MGAHSGHLGRPSVLGYTAISSSLTALAHAAGTLGQAQKGQWPGHIVIVSIVSGDALASSSKFTASLKPSPQTVEHHHLVPRSASGIDGSSIADVKIAAGEIVRDKWAARSLENESHARISRPIRS